MGTVEAKEKPITFSVFDWIALAFLIAFGVFCIGMVGHCITRDYYETLGEVREEANAKARKADVAEIQNRAARAGLGKYVTKPQWRGEPVVEFEWGACDPTKPETGLIEGCVFDGEGKPGIHLSTGGVMKGVRVNGGIPVHIGAGTFEVANQLETP